MFVENCEVVARTDVPEPGSLALLIGLGVTGAVFCARCRKQANKAA